jgi:hypothetical protein
MHAILLVVKLHVKPYNPKREESRSILPLAGCQGPWTPKEAWVLAGGHDVFRFFNAALAAD